VKEGIAREVGEDQIRIKEPQFLYADSAANLGDDDVFDFAVAQSIFSHCGRDLLERWLKEVSEHLSHSGAMVATFIGGAVDFVGSGWVYPSCVTFRLESMLEMSMSAGLRFRLLDWRHPRQHWALFAAPDSRIPGWLRRRRRGIRPWTQGCGNIDRRRTCRVVSGSSSPRDVKGHPNVLVTRE